METKYENLEVKDMKKVKLTQEKQRDFDDIFNQPEVQDTLSGLTPEQIERYKAIGEQLFGSVDFEKNAIIQPNPKPMDDKLKYVCLGLDSGLHPSMMDLEEILTVRKAYGPKWYEKWNYTQEDLKPL